MGREGTPEAEPLSPLRLPRSQRFVPPSSRHVASQTLESGPGTFPLPLSGSLLLFLQISVQASSSRESCPGLPDKVHFPCLCSCHSAHLSFRAHTTVCSSPLCLSLNKLEAPGSQDLGLFCLQFDSRHFTQHLAYSRYSVLNRLTAYDRICVHAYMS